MPRLQTSALFDSDSGIRKVRLIDNVVAVKDAPRFVTRYSHGYDFRHSPPNHVPHRRTTHVVKEQPGEVRRLDELGPCGTKISNGFAIPTRDNEVLSRG